MGLGKDLVGVLDRCMYGTRDAGAIWEQVYTDALVQMGFVQGVASPCCFHHPEWQISVVVHGDDFTALGTDASLQKYEDSMKAAFEIKLKGRLGSDPGDLKEMRVLNRIVRICPEGLLYESDPRHVELLAKALHLEDCKPAPSPGSKPKVVEDASEDDAAELQDIVAMLKHQRLSQRKVSFGHVTVLSNVPTWYRTIPRDHLLAGPIGSVSTIPLAAGCHPYTGQPSSEMLSLRARCSSSPNMRSQIMRKVLLEGSAWETQITDLLHAMVGKKKYKQKRIGCC